jgi:hypothetical protein
MEIDSAFIEKRRRSRQFYPLATFGAVTPALPAPILAIPNQMGGKSAVLPGFAQPIALPLPSHLQWRLSTRRAIRRRAGLS